MHDLLSPRALSVSIILGAVLGGCIATGEDGSPSTVDGVDAQPDVAAPRDAPSTDESADSIVKRDADASSDSTAPDAAAPDATVSDVGMADVVAKDDGVDAPRPDAVVDTAVRDGSPTVDSGPTSAHDLYVATTGSDSNPGTKAAPFKTILRASEVAVPDTTIHVASGTYTGGFLTRKSGTASGRIHYLADVRWGARIVPPSSSSSKMGWDNRGAYVTIDGFEVDGSVDPTSGTIWTVGINVGGQGDVVTHCHVHHIFNHGTPSSSGGAGILLDAWYGFNDMQALGNVVHHAGPTSSGGGTWYHGIYQTATGVISNNLVYANAGGGVHLWHDANHITIANNTSFGNGIGYIVGGGDYVHTSGPCDYITVINNIAFDNTGIGFDEEGGVGTHNQFTNNLSFKNGTNWRLKLTPHTADVTADPLFVRYVRTGGGDYRLSSVSPAIDKGRATGAPAIDFYEGSRPYGAALDIGAHEWRP
jgi:hypothetical protein